MSSASFCTQPNPVNLKIPVLVIAGLLLALVVGGIAIADSSHAVMRHGSDAEQIRSCLDRNGPSQVWQASVERNTFYQICKMPDNRWGMQAVKRVFEKGKWQWVEKTAFIKGDGLLSTLRTYLNQFAAPSGATLPPLP